MVKGLRNAVLGVPIVVLLLIGGFAATPMLATCGGHDEVVTAALLKCPRAVEIIGADAHPARLGLACGTTQTGSGQGHASWRLPYTGSRGRGTVRFTAYQVNGDWQLQAAVLEGDENIDLLACAGGAPSGRPGDRIIQTNADAATAKLEGKVIRSNHPTILTGSTCSGNLARERGATTAHVTVTCKGGVGESGAAPTGEIALYDGDGTFKMEVGDPSRRDDDASELEDAKTSDQDKTPGCRLSSAAGKGTLTIWDTTPAFELVIDL